MRILAAVLVATLTAGSIHLAAAAQGRGGANGGYPMGGGMPLAGSTSTHAVGAPMGGYYYPGFGYSSHPLNPYTYGYPTGYPGGGYVGGGYGYGAPVGVPVAVGGGSGFFKIGPVGIQYWRAPSGYYYPWGYNTGGIGNAPVYIVQQNSSTPQKPPMSSFFNDLQKYMDENKEKGRISDSDFAHLFRRLQDLRAKFDHQMALGGGSMDTTDEDTMRRDAEQLASEISTRIKVAPAKVGY